MMSTPVRKRLRLDRAEGTEHPDGRRHVKVTLTLGQLIFHAGAESTSGNATAVLKAAAAATLEAVQLAGANKFSCTLADLDHVNALGKDLVAVLVDIKFQSRN